MIFAKMSVSRVALIAALLAGATAANAQLVQKKAPAQSSADTINLSGVSKNRPLVYSDSVAQRNEKATSEAISAMDLEYSNDSLTGTLIGIGADYVGQTVKNMLSPNSAEADAVEREWQKR